MNWWKIIMETAAVVPAKRTTYWTDNEEILCKSEEIAETIANMIETLYWMDGEKVSIQTGYYDPKEDEDEGKADEYTGWWYVVMD